LAWAAVPPGTVAQPGSGDTIAESGDAAGAAACVACHGDNGEGRISDDGAFPRLAGLDDGYFAKQLKDFKEGRRRSDVMEPIAQALSASEITTLAKYYAALSAPPLPGLVQQGHEIDSDGARLAALGKWVADVPPCLSCHGPNGVGVAPSFPYLAGQPAAYIEAQMRNWRNGDRHNDPLGMMTRVARALDDREIVAVAAYFQMLMPPLRQGEP
jgi:cytochrome c553